MPSAFRTECAFESVAEGGVAVLGEGVRVDSGLLGYGSHSAFELSILVLLPPSANTVTVSLRKKGNVTVNRRNAHSKGMVLEFFFGRSD